MPNDATERKTTPNFCVENKHFVIEAESACDEEGTRIIQ